VENMLMLPYITGPKWSWLWSRGITADIVLHLP